MVFSPSQFLVALVALCPILFWGCPWELGHEIATGTYNVRSDCPNAVQAGQLMVVEGDASDTGVLDEDEDDEIDPDESSGTTDSVAAADVVDDADASLSFNEYVITGAIVYGFPTEALERGSVDSDVVRSSDGIRKCEAKLVEELGDFALFRCSEEGQLICTITLTKA